MAFEADGDEAVDLREVGGGREVEVGEGSRVVVVRGVSVESPSCPCASQEAQGNIESSPQCLICSVM